MLTNNYLTLGPANRGFPLWNMGPVPPHAGSPGIESVSALSSPGPPEPEVRNGEPTVAELMLPLQYR